MLLMRGQIDFLGKLLIAILANMIAPTIISDVIQQVPFVFECL